MDALRLFLFGLLKGIFKLRRELEFVLQKIVERAPKLRQLSLGKLMKLGFDFFDLAHGCRLNEAGPRDKEGAPKAEGGRRKMEGGQPNCHFSIIYPPFSPQKQRL